MCATCGPFRGPDCSLGRGPTPGGLASPGLASLDELYTLKPVVVCLVCVDNIMRTPEARYSAYGGSGGIISALCDAVGERLPGVGNRAICDRALEWRP